MDRFTQKNQIFKYISGPYSPHDDLQVILRYVWFGSGRGTLMKPLQKNASGGIFLPKSDPFHLKCRDVGGLLREVSLYHRL